MLGNTKEDLLFPGSSNPSKGMKIWYESILDTSGLRLYRLRTLMFYFMKFS